MKTGLARRSSVEPKIELRRHTVLCAKYRIMFSIQRYVIRDCKICIRSFYPIYQIIHFNLLCKIPTQIRTRLFDSCDTKVINSVQIISFFLRLNYLSQN